MLVLRQKNRLIRSFSQAEQRIYNSVQFPAIRKNVTGSNNNINKYLSSPSDFLAVYSMAVIRDDGSYLYLLNKDVNFIRQAYPTPTDTTAFLNTMRCLGQPRLTHSTGHYK
jgi:hypothetical protein